MDWIEAIISHVFCEIPYSAAAQEAKSRFKLALNEKALELEGQTQSEIAGALLSRYGSLAAASELIQTDLSALKTEPPLEGPDAKRLCKRLERRTFFACGGFFLAINALLNFFMGEHIYLSAVLLWTAFFLAFSLRLFPLWRVRYGKCSLAFGAAEHFLFRRDTFRKRYLNSIFIGSTLVAVFIVSLTANAHMGTLNQQEFSQISASNFNFALLGLFLIAKNGLRVLFYNRLFDPAQSVSYKRYCRNIWLLTAVYFAAVLIATLLLFDNLVVVWNLWRIVTLSYIVLFPSCNFFLRRRFEWAKIHINKKRIAVVATAAVLYIAFLLLNSASWLIQPYISSIPYVPHRQHEIRYEEETGVYTIVSDVEDFKILQLTDIHLGGSMFSAVKDNSALKAVYTLIKETEPDFVMITGDLVFPLGIMSFSLNNYTPVMQFASFMRNIGVPWAFAYGNHDTEMIATHTDADLMELFRSLSYQYTRNLLYPQVQPDITGRNNQLVKIENRAGNLRTALIILDSNAYTGEGINSYDYIHDDQVIWYEQQIKSLNAAYGATVPSLLFFHIPLTEYQTAYDLYKANSDEVQYYFGRVGEKDEAISCSKYDSRLFDKVVELDSTKAIFVGHDHYNNISLGYQGVRLTYSLSIDYLAMPGISEHTEQRGGTLITVYKNGEYGVE
ncbi:metallophosphoesterase family protein, partial [Christensenellaceae bacterium OttesenSCG-928-M15]|nr:metallophosphoesterase family protein [Christensenellaceae bacterium OttesenSCG-928-M15]